jgi:hypothetical protein
MFHLRASRDPRRASSLPDLVGQQTSETLFPLPHCFITEFLATNQKQVQQVAQT